MMYPNHSPADYQELGYERIDACTLPRVKPIAFETVEPNKDVYFIFHVAGCAYTQYAALNDIDAELTEGMDGPDAYRLGLECGRNARCA